MFYPPTFVPNASLDNQYGGLRVVAGDDGKLWYMEYVGNSYTRSLIKDFGAAKLQIQGYISLSTATTYRSELIVTSTLNGNTSTQSLDLTSANLSNIRDVSTITFPANEYSSYPNSFVEINGKILFKATDNERGEELWRTDGTTAGTTLFKEFIEGVNGLFNSRTLVENGFAYYAVPNFNTAQNSYWKTDGTTIDSIRSTTAEYQTINNKFNQGQNYPALTVGNAKYQTYYSTYSLCSRCPNAYLGGFQRILGADTSFVFSFNYVSCGASAISSLQPLGNKIFFTFHQELTSSNCDKRGALWGSDGTAAGTKIVKTFMARPSDIVVANNKLYFTANDGVNGLALFTSDGTEAGTRVVTNFVTSPALSADIGVQKMFVQGNSLYFILANLFNGAQSSLWAYNLNGNSVVKITNLSETFSGSNNQGIVFNGHLLLPQTTNDVGTELFKIALTEAPLGTPLSNVSDLSLTQTILPTRTPDTLFLDVAMTVKNNGSQTANNVKTTFPSLGTFGLYINSDAPLRDTVFSTGFLTDNYSTWFIQSLGVNQTATFTYRLVVPKYRIVKTILRTTVKSDQFDGNVANNFVEYPLELTAPCTAPISGSLLVDYYNDQVTDASPIVIQNPNTPSGSYLSNGASASNFSDQYIRRARGYIKPSESGNYRFYIAGDDNVDVYLSTDDNPANKRRIAYLQGFTGSIEFTKYASQTSNLVNLTAGRRYYVEIVNAEKFGDDLFNLNWTTPSVSARSAIPVEQIESFCGEPVVVNLPDLTLANLTISTPSVQQGQNALFTFDAKNIGTANATNPFTIKSYLSTDAILDANDYQNGSIPTANYIAGANITQIQGALNVSNSVAIGSYYLILKIDAYNQITESNETNNVLVSASTIAVTVVNTSTYCVSKGVAPWEYAIANVNLNTLNNTSDKFKDINTLGYSDYTNLTTTLTKGQSYPLSITPLLSWIGNLPNAYCRVWIDFNQNKTFEANELVLEKTNANPLTQSVLVPTTATIGTTRMRVSLKFGGYPTACETFEKGEVEDYTLIIQDGTACVNRYVVENYGIGNCIRISQQTYGNFAGIIQQYGQNIADGFMFNYHNLHGRGDLFARNGTIVRPANAKFSNCSGNWLYFTAEGGEIINDARSTEVELKNIPMRIKIFGNTLNADSIYVEMDSTWNSESSNSLVSISKSLNCNNTCITTAHPPIFKNCPTNIVNYAIPYPDNLYFNQLNQQLNISVVDTCLNLSKSNNFYALPNVDAVSPGTFKDYKLIAYDIQGNKSICAFKVAFVSTNTSNDISLTLTSTPSVYRQYTTQSFRVSAKNTGSQAFTNVKIKFYRPDLTVSGGTKVASIGTYQDYCPNNIECSEWTVPTLAGGTTATLDVPVYVLNPTGAMTATATLLSSNPVDNSVANNTATVIINASNSPTPQALIQSKPTQLIPVIIQKMAPTLTENYIIVELESIVEKTIDFQIINALGNVVLIEKIKIGKGNNKFDFNVSQLPQGLYFIQTNVGKGRNVPTKFIKL